MDKQRIFLIDTDTGSDDAVAIIMALKCKDVKFEAITTVAGNVTIEQANKNALISCEVAGTYMPPVYAGMDRPLLRKLIHSYETHGEDGMGNMDLAEPAHQLSEGHGIDVMIDMARKYDGELEIVALGPLTNIAMAVLKAPDIAKKIKKLYIMGTSGFAPGNVSPVAEFNIWADPEACDVVLKSGIDQVYVGWDMCCGDAMLEPEDIAYLDKETECSHFCIRCNKCLMELNEGRFGHPCLDMADPVAMAVALWPDLIIEAPHAYTYVETHSEQTLGQVVCDWTNTLGKEPNATMCKKLDNPRMKKLMMEHML